MDFNAGIRTVNASLRVVRLVAKLEILRTKVARPLEKKRQTTRLPVLRRIWVINLGSTLDGDHLRYFGKSPKAIYRRREIFS